MEDNKMIDEIYNIHLTSSDKTNNDKIKTGYVWSRKEKVILSLTEEEGGIKNKWIIRLVRGCHYWERKVKNESKGMLICKELVQKYDLEPNPDRYAEFTICKECENLIEKDDSDKSLCKSVKRNVETDHYDGKEKPYDFDPVTDKKFFTDEIYKFCKSVNTYGKCRYFKKRLKIKKDDNWKVGDLAYIPNAVYDYFRKPSKITKIEGEYAWLDVPDDNPVKLEQLKKVIK